MSRDCSRAGWTRVAISRRQEIDHYIKQGFDVKMEHARHDQCTCDTEHYFRSPCTISVMILNIFVLSSRSYTGVSSIRDE